MRQTSQLRLLEKNSAQFFIGKVSTCSPTVSFWKPEVETYLLVYFSFICSDFGEKDSLRKGHRIVYTKTDSAQRPKCEKCSWTLSWPVRLLLCRNMNLKRIKSGVKKWWTVDFDFIQSVIDPWILTGMMRVHWRWNTQLINPAQWVTHWFILVV